MKLPPPRIYDRTPRGVDNFFEVGGAIVLV